ncbi:MAG: hypothetical protein HC817_08295 [Saprospiraceae bacterium]|nr:hypothetical protein [Saprospiraceae bacterium]
MSTQLKITYRQIFAIAMPLILGSAGQNIIALSDGVFLFFYDRENGFPAIGIVGVFYLVITAIGYGFSKGGQVLIARRMGEGKPEEVGRNFFDMLYFELGLAILYVFIHAIGLPCIVQIFLSATPKFIPKVLNFYAIGRGVFFLVIRV